METTKKLLVILQKQRHTLKENTFKYMVKEVRYELLELLESLTKKVGTEEQKTEDGKMCYL